MWQEKQEKSTELPTKLIDVFQACDSITFPKIHVLLHLVLTLPIISCESERSFSQLKLVKIARRSTMTTSRLGDLTLMKINRSYCDQLYIKDLVQTFAQMHSRRMKLPFILNDNMHARIQLKFTVALLINFLSCKCVLCMAI